MSARPTKASRKVLPKMSQRDIELLHDFYAAEARQSYWAYRQYMNPNLITGWFPQHLSYQLQEFYRDLARGAAPMLVIMAPPQHGKSYNLWDFLAWVAGRRPDYNSILGSYSQNLGIRANTYLQRTYDAARYQRVFPNTRINSENVVTVSGRPQRNASLIEYVNDDGQMTGGSFRNTTVNGQVTGMGLDFGVLDDPLKGRAEASSPQMRNKIWNWIMDDWFSRFSNNAGMIMTMTRWHVDDPVGRWLEVFPDTIVLRYPAIAEKNDKYRNKGDPLFPEFKSLAFLEKRRKAYTQASWSSLYQQNPIVVGGGVFPIERIQIVNSFDRSMIKRSIRYWDKAGTADAGAYTAGVLLHYLKDGIIVIEDVRRGQWNAFDRERIIKQTAQIDTQYCERGKFAIWIEKEPGSGGKESAERTIVNLAPYPIFADNPAGKGSKEVRAEPFQAQVQGGMVRLLARPWNKAFLEELETFPNGKYKDQVDAAAAAFIKAVGDQYAYDISQRWAG